MAQGTGALTTFSATAEASQMTARSEEQRLAAENLYRDANTLIYGDNKPSEDAIDQLVSKINKECVVLDAVFSFERNLELSFTASTRKASSPGSATTRMKATLHTSMNTIVSSIKR